MKVDTICQVLFVVESSCGAFGIVSCVEAVGITTFDLQQQRWLSTQKGTEECKQKLHPHKMTKQMKNKWKRTMSPI